MTSVRLTCSLALLLPLAACTTTPSSSAPVARADAPPPKLLLISIDGLRADALDRGMTPNLQRIIDGGVRARWMTPSYPSLTFPNHYTIVTGLRPDHHGIVNNSMDDAQLGRFALSDRDAVTNSGWWGGEPIWVGAEKVGVRTATTSWPGSEAEIDGTRPSQWQVYDGKEPLQQRARTVLEWLAQTDADAPRLTTLYMENVDKAGHTYGPDSTQYRDAIVQADQIVGQVLDGLDAAGLAATTNVIVVSDHGMASVAEGHVVSTESMADPSIARNVSQGQSVGFAPVAGREAQAERALLGRHAHYECWKKESLPARWHYGTHPRVPPIVCQMDEGWDALHAERIAKRDRQERGSHGYDNALPSMRAVFVARGPSFHQGLVIDGFDNVDVYPLLAHLLQVPAAPNDGNAETLQKTLR
ncbi:TPA: alkaline phosphatase family protein [Stenotrophomonas maltophilia]|uniref:alkaline phosphatase family protein n=1 Tax=Stenotrophomonas maltophilia TaxID=40324 RepID=UPI0031B98B2B|nr:alkaline phosphatase family protein [Stenotrophomonas maltophilia]HDS1028055.1 alkaline phosphatase family protein [Stenotrophomonas maltophilia]HDS1032387.1 alkaline phosphatase family protein [Stenotrophomonas maltophilia]HDS1033481.1 alkaline phosphatase family protein [Stenotrophomonas maltophilia]HDS1040992.1 alkaline phosphatase family protein [Stenotrophomonas maltophilia]